MSKREARSFAAAGVDVGAKRRKEAPATSKPNGEAATANGAAKEGAENGGSEGEDRDTVREKGLALWQTLKDAVNKECVIYLAYLPVSTPDRRLRLSYRPPPCPRSRSCVLSRL